MNRDFTKTVCILIVCLVWSLVLVSCGVPDDVMREARDKVARYTPSFKQRVEDAYGKDAKLTDIKCEIDRVGSSPVPKLSYKTRSYLSGTIKIDGKKYDAIYQYDTDTVYDTVHTADICREIIKSLPVDSSRFYGVRIIDSNLDYPRFRAGVDCIDNAAAAGSVYSPLRIYIVTTENLSNLKTFNLESISEMKKIAKSDSFDCSITIVSCKDKSRISSLMGAVQDIQFYSSGHPEMVSKSGSTEDVFDYYGIRCVIRYNYAYGANEAFYVE